MGRKRSTTREFFNYDAENDVSVCKVCKFKMSGSYITNLKRQVMKNHLQQYNEEVEATDAENNPSTAIKRKFSVTFSAEELRNACIDLVTKESLPFAILDCDAFKVLTKKVFNGLGIPRVSSRNIMNYVTKQYDNLRQKIKNLCKEKLICLKMDTATRLDRSILGINIQVLQHGNIEIYILGMTELNARHTGVYLKEQMEKVLQDFDIQKKQIFCITTDNGKNMLKAVDTFSMENSNEFVESEEAINPENSKNALIQNLYEGEEGIISVKCAAHTLQLAAKDFLCSIEDGVISRAREVVKDLRTPTIRCSLQLLQLSKPRLDVATRWNSTYDMLHRLLQYEEFCKERLSSHLTDNDWITIHNIVELLNPVYAATMQLQDSKLLLGDFYKLWVNLRCQIGEMKTQVVENLLACLKERESHLLNNDIINAAIFLDPRIKRTLTRDKKNKAKSYLKNFATRMLSLKQDTSRIAARNAAEREDSSVTLDGVDLLNASTNRNASLLRSAVCDMEIDSSTDEEYVDENLLRITEAHKEIDKYKETRVDVDVALMDYWREKSYTLPYLTKIPKVTHSVPATQVSVERCFSSLKIIMSDRRYNLSAENLEKLLFVKLNNK